MLQTMEMVTSMTDDTLSHLKHGPTPAPPGQCRKTARWEPGARHVGGTTCVRNRAGARSDKKDIKGRYFLPRLSTDMGSRQTFTEHSDHMQKESEGYMTRAESRVKGVTAAAQEIFNQSQDLLARGDASYAPHMAGLDDKQSTISPFLSRSLVRNSVTR